MNKYVISTIRSSEVIDNRGTPTIRAYVCVGDEFWGQADVPCGSSTGTHEAKELRDGDSRYRGKGVRKAIRNIQVAIDSIGLIPTEQLKIMRIKNTASLSEVMLSDAYKNELSERDDLELITESKPMTFDSNGNLAAF